MQAAIASWLILSLRRPCWQNEFKMKMDCPGVESEDLNIECEGNVLRVRRVLRRAASYGTTAATLLLRR